MRHTATDKSDAAATEIIKLLFRFQTRPQRDGRKTTYVTVDNTKDGVIYTEGVLKGYIALP